MFKNGETYILKRDEAISLFHEMWNDIKKKYGEFPDPVKLHVFKVIWLDEHHYAGVMNNCFLCEYANTQSLKNYEPGTRICDFCPINWAPLCKKRYFLMPHNFFRSKSLYGTCQYINSCFKDVDKVLYLTMPTSSILALPERK